MIDKFHRADAPPTRRTVRRRWVLGLGLQVAVMQAAGGSGGDAPQPVRDVISRPPSPRQFVSPSGRFRLVLQLQVPERPPRVNAQLFDDGGGSPGRLVWQQQLPHSWGPRVALVTDEGRVVLVDEWINVASRRALTLLDAQGAVQTVIPAEQIFSLLAVPRRSIADAATAGVWRTGEPTLSADGQTVELRAAHRKLHLSTSTGQLSLVD